MMPKNAFSWDEWGSLDGLGLASRVKAGDVTVAEVVAQASVAIGMVDGPICGIVEHFAQASIETLSSASDSKALLAGVPVLLKDLGAGLAGHLQESGSALCRGHVSDRTDPFIEHILASGLVPIGRSTTAEFGLGWDATNIVEGGLRITRNPYDTTRTSGGSSGGSAALVAAGAVPIATSSDGGGSTRIPASHCGLVGLKPTRGLCPRPLDSNEAISRISTDGVLTRSVRDTAAVLDHTARIAPGGSFMQVMSEAGYYLASLDEPVSRKPVIGLSTGCWGRNAAPDAHIAARIDEVALLLRELGYEVREILDDAIADWPEIWESYTINWMAARGSLAQTAAANGRSVEELADYVTPMVYRMFLESQRYDVASLYRMMAMNNRQTRAYGRLFETIDVLLTPAFAAPVPEANGASSTLCDTGIETWFGTQLDNARYAILCNEVGAPAISLPCGPGQDGLPIGFQLCGAWRDEKRLLQLAAAIERARPEWFCQRPNVHVAAASHQA